MVYYNKTLIPCHKLTKEGALKYHLLLEKKADEILYRHQHPFKWFFEKMT
jgi:hypothetical protein